MMPDERSASSKTFADEQIVGPRRPFHAFNWRWRRCHDRIRPFKRFEIEPSFAGS